MSYESLTARLHVEGPFNIEKVVKRLNLELSKVKLDLDKSITGNASMLLLVNTIKELNKTIKASKSLTDGLSKSLEVYSKVSSSSASATKSQNNAITDASKQHVLLSNSIRNTNSELYEFGRLSGLAFRRFTAFALPTSAAFGLFTSVKSGLQDAITFERQMIRVAQSTGNTVKNMKAVSDQIRNLAESFGASSTELVEVARLFAQAGFNANQMQEAIEAVAKTSLSPSFDSMSETAKGAIAIINQFKIKTTELEEVFGGINRLAAQSAVDAKDIITATQTAGGVFSVMSEQIRGIGGDLLSNKEKFFQFASLFTSIRDTTQESAESISTALRSIFTRLIRPESIKLIEDLKLEIRDLNGEVKPLKLTDENGLFIGNFEALQRMGQAFDGINSRSVALATILEDLGGVRLQGKLIPALKQYAQQQELLTVANQSGLSLDKDREVALTSLGRQMDQTAEKFRTFISDIEQSDTFKTITSAALTFANALIEIGDAFRPLLPIFAGSIAIKGVSAYKNFGDVTKGFFEGIQASGGVRAFTRKSFTKRAMGGSINNEPNSLLMPGEFVIDPDQVRQIGVSRLQKFNADGNLSHLDGYSLKPIIVPGQGYSDSVPANLPNGSFVIRKKHSENAMRQNNAKSFASGGYNDISNKDLIDIYSGKGRDFTGTGFNGVMPDDIASDTKRRGLYYPIEGSRFYGGKLSRSLLNIDDIDINFPYDKLALFDHPYVHFGYTDVPEDVLSHEELQALITKQLYNKQPRNSTEYYRLLSKLRDKSIELGQPAQGYSELDYLTSLTGEKILKGNIGLYGIKGLRGNKFLLDHKPSDSTINHLSELGIEWTTDRKEYEATKKQTHPEIAEIRKQVKPSKAFGVIPPSLDQLTEFARIHTENPLELYGKNIEDFDKELAEETIRKVYENKENHIKNRGISMPDPKDRAEWFLKNIEAATDSHGLKTIDLANAIFEASKSGVVDYEYRKYAIEPGKMLEAFGYDAIEALVPSKDKKGYSTILYPSSHNRVFAGNVPIKPMKFANGGMFNIQNIKPGKPFEIPRGTIGIRNIMQDITSRTGNEVALYRDLKSKKRYGVVGTPDSVHIKSKNYRLIAHTHPPGYSTRPSDYQDTGPFGNDVSLLMRNYIQNGQRSSLILPGSKNTNDKPRRFFVPPKLKKKGKYSQYAENIDGLREIEKLFYNRTHPFYSGYEEKKPYNKLIKFSRGGRKDKNQLIDIDEYTLNQEPFNLQQALEEINAAESVGYGKNRKEKRAESRYSSKPVFPIPEQKAFGLASSLLPNIIRQVKLGQLQNEDDDYNAPFLPKPKYTIGTSLQFDLGPDLNSVNYQGFTNLGVNEELAKNLAIALSAQTNKDKAYSSPIGKLPNTKTLTASPSPQTLQSSLSILPQDIKNPPPNYIKDITDDIPLGPQTDLNNRLGPVSVLLSKKEQLKAAQQYLKTQGYAGPQYNRAVTNIVRGLQSSPNASINELISEQESLQLQNPLGTQYVSRTAAARLAGSRGYKSQQAKKTYFNRLTNTPSNYGNSISSQDSELFGPREALLSSGQSVVYTPRNPNKSLYQLAATSASEDLRKRRFKERTNIADKISSNFGLGIDELHEQQNLSGRTTAAGKLIKPTNTGRVVSEDSLNRVSTVFKDITTDSKLLSRAYRKYIQALQNGATEQTAATLAVNRLKRLVQNNTSGFGNGGGIGIGSITKSFKRFDDFVNRHQVALGVGTYLAAPAISAAIQNADPNSVDAARTGGFIGGAAIGAYTGAQIGAFAGPYGPAIGAVGGALFGGFTSASSAGAQKELDLSTKNISKSLKFLQNAFQDFVDNNSVSKFEEKLEYLNKTSLELRDASLKQAKSIFAEQNTITNKIGDSLLAAGRAIVNLGEDSDNYFGHYDKIELDKKIRFAQDQKTNDLLRLTGDFDNAKTRLFKETRSNLPGIANIDAKEYVSQSLEKGTAEQVLLPLLARFGRAGAKSTDLFLENRALAISDGGADTEDRINNLLSDLKPLFVEVVASHQNYYDSINKIQLAIEQNTLANDTYITHLHRLSETLSKVANAAQIADNRFDSFATLLQSGLNQNNIQTQNPFDFPLNLTSKDTESQLSSIKNRYLVGVEDKDLDNTNFASISRSAKESAKLSELGPKLLAESIFEYNQKRASDNKDEVIGANFGDILSQKFGKDFEGTSFFTLLTKEIKDINKDSNRDFSVENIERVKSLVNNLIQSSSSGLENVKKLVDQDIANMQRFSLRANAAVKSLFDLSDKLDEIVDIKQNLENQKLQFSNKDILPSKIVDDQLSFVRELTSRGGTAPIINPTDISARIKKAEKDIQKDQDELATLPSESRQKDLITNIINNTNILNDHKKALDNLSKSNGVLSAVQNRLVKLEEQRGAGQNILERISIAATNPEEYLKLVKDIKDALDFKGGIIRESGITNGIPLLESLAKFEGKDKEFNEAKNNLLLGALRNGIGQPGSKNAIDFLSVLSERVKPVDQQVEGKDAISKYEQAVQLQIDALDAQKVAIQQNSQTLTDLNKTMLSIDFKELRSLLLQKSDVNIGGKHAGGIISGQYRGNRDTEIRRLVPGEFVVRRNVTQKHIGLLSHLNNTGELPQFADGGFAKPLTRANFFDKTKFTKEQLDIIQRQVDKNKQKVMMVSSKEDLLAENLEKRKNKEKEILEQKRRLSEEKFKAYKNRLPSTASGMRRRYIAELRLRRHWKTIIEKDNKKNKNKPVNQQPVNQQPVNQQPVNQQPVNQQPVNQQPVNQQPVNQQPVNQQPVNQQPVNQQPVNQQPVNQQPVNQQPVTPKPLRQYILDQNQTLPHDYFDQFLSSNEDGKLKSTLNSNPLDPFNAFRRLQTFNSGGQVDSIMAAVTPGEFIVRKNVASRHAGFLENLNKTGKLPGFADGGMIGSSGVNKGKADGDGWRIPQDLISALNTFSNTSKELSIAIGSLNDLSKVANQLAMAASSFAKINIPSVIKFESAPIQVNVVVNGQEAFIAMQDSIRDLVTTKINDAISKHINVMTGETNESFFHG